MYCHHCGERILSESRFCTICGSKVQIVDEKIEVYQTGQLTNGQEAPTQQQVEPQEIDNEDGQSPEQNKNLITRSLPVFLPLVSVIFVLSFLIFIYLKEQKINDEVLNLKESAEELAIQGKYTEAKKDLEAAHLKRSNYAVLQDDLILINKAIEYQESLMLISENIKNTDFHSASKELASLKEKVNVEQSPIFKTFQEQMEESDIKITIGTIKKELNELTSIEELGGKLSILASLPEKEANAVKKEILNKIVQISTDQVENQLSNHQFSEAFSIINEGLQYAVNNEKLLALKNRVDQDKLAFEQAEQERIELAMEAAAQEDLKNRTEAVSISDFAVEVDEYGDLYVTGSAENIATTSISSITIYYSIYNKNGEFIDEGYTSVYPYYINPGEVGYFEDIYYGVYQEVNVEIDNITWYLE